MIEAWLGHAGIPLDTRARTGSALLGAFGSGDFQWVRARIPANLVPSLAALPAVEFIDPVVPVHPLNQETDWVIQTNLTANDRYWTFGLDGTGQSGPLGRSRPVRVVRPPPGRPATSGAAPRPATPRPG